MSIFKLYFWPETLSSECNSFLFQPPCLYIADQEWKSASDLARTSIFVTSQKVV